MIKRIGQQNLLTTPFVTTKEWTLANVHNDDLLLVEQSSSIGVEIPVALDYIDYYGTYPFLNRECNIALEQQTEDEAVYREGEKRTGTFYPDSEPKNTDGTYKRLIYFQNKQAFYNNWRNPIELFGLENIDLQLSNTERYLSDFFREFVIPKEIVGDRLTEGSVRLYDQTLDDNVDIFDDSYGNLVATKNLFSKIQEVRKLWNEIYSGSVNIGCPPITQSVPEAPTSLTASLTCSYSASLSGGYTGSYYTVNLSWRDNSTIEDGFYVWRYIQTSAESTWSLATNIATLGVNETTYSDVIYNVMASASYYVNAFNLVGNSTNTNTASVTMNCTLV